MTVKYLSHNKLTEEDLNKIIDIKSIAWPYSKENQLSWIKENINDNDIHVLLLDEEQHLDAYLNLAFISFEINDKEYNGYGIGNVCAARRGDGKGAMLMKELQKYFLDNKKIGLLFCKEALLDFYHKHGWEFVAQNKVIVTGINVETKTMILNYDCNSIEKLIYSQRIF